MEELERIVDGAQTIGVIGVYGLCCAYLGGGIFADRFDDIARTGLAAVTKLVDDGYERGHSRFDDGDDDDGRCARVVDGAKMCELRRIVCESDTVDPDLDLLVWRVEGQTGWCSCIGALCVCAMQQQTCADVVCDELGVSRLDGVVLDERRCCEDDDDDDDDGKCVAETVARVQLSYCYMHELRVHEEVRDAYMALVKKKMRNAIIAAAAETIDAGDLMCIGEDGKCTARRVRETWVREVRHWACDRAQATPAFDLALCVLVGVGHADECTGCQWGRVQDAAVTDLARMCGEKKWHETVVFYLN